MARIVTKTAHKPFELTAQGNSTSICMCGLSENQPFCDSSHKKTLDEKKDTVYKYDGKGERIELCSGCDCTDASECTCDCDCACEK